MLLRADRDGEVTFEKELSSSFSYFPDSVEKNSPFKQDDPFIIKNILFFI